MPSGNGAIKTLLEIYKAARDRFLILKSFIRCLTLAAAHIIYWT
jgi:hypothetical protein